MWHFICVSKNCKQLNFTQNDTYDLIAFRRWLASPSLDLERKIIIRIKCQIMTLIYVIIREVVSNHDLFAQHILINKGIVSFTNFFRLCVMQRETMPMNAALSSCFRQCNITKKKKKYKLKFQIKRTRAFSKTICKYWEDDKNTKIRISKS